ncbi:PREDICTED: uncharacterized protein LOC108611639 [Drosophila arizonae]|uniref:Uncharacterized protein LOC108611639 n=1 Tax=Drosophila arizonae TaxID=7263 RepID=A0ABM1NY37_DROAR|nr:PREDICTED: uncharacterized protein LOC108611639 [Drosophila arizonae]
MANFKTLLLVVTLLNSGIPVAEAAAIVDPKPSSVSALYNFLESNQDELGWTQFLPTNFYSELNQQHYMRFRRHSRLQLKDLRRARPYPFEYARYL